MASPGYTDDEIEAIAGWLRDGLSGNEVARRLTVRRGVNVSRNAIIGIVLRNKTLHAIGFARSPALGRKDTAHTPPAPRLVTPALKIQKQVALHSQNNIARKMAKPVSKPVVVAMRIPLRVVCREITLLELKKGDCRWPSNDPERPGDSPHLFCGLPADPDRSYCPHHYQRSIGRGTESERSAERVLEKAAAA